MNKNNFWAFNIIEIIIGIFIFSLWMAAIYSIIYSTITLQNHTDDRMIAMYLASEQLEIMRNIRDTNFLKLQTYNQISPLSDNYYERFEPGNYYKIANDFSSYDSYQKVEPLSVTQSYTYDSMQSYRLYLDSDGNYTYEENGNTPTRFYRYIFIDIPYNLSDDNIKNAMRVESKVFWYDWKMREYSIRSILTNWKQL